MQIEIQTHAYSQNANYIAITAAIYNNGYDYHLQLGGKKSCSGVVTLTTKAPISILDGVKYTKSAVTVRA